MDRISFVLDLIKRREDVVHLSFRHVAACASAPGLHEGREYFKIIIFSSQGKTQMPSGSGVVLQGDQRLSLLACRHTCV